MPEFRATSVQVVEQVPSNWEYVGAVIEVAPVNARKYSRSEIVLGSLSTSLRQPSSIVISKSNCTRLFGACVDTVLVAFSLRVHIWFSMA